MAQPNISKNDTTEMQRSVPAPFLTKTYQIVDDSATDDIISWNECGSAFVVWRPPEFARDLLPNHFKHNNFSSFVRQLNTYGFKKTVPDRWEFANDFFKKGERHLLIDIHRHKALYVASVRSLPSKRSLSPTTSVEEQAASSGSSARGISAAYSDESEKLKTENMLLAAEVSCLRSLCMDLFLHIQSHSMISAENLGHINRLFSRLPNCSITLDNYKVSERALGKKIKVESNKHKAHDHRHVQRGNLLAICDASLGSRPNGPPKLFGVPLPGRGHRFLEPILEHGRQ